METRRREDAPLKAPNAEGNVWPKQVCPAFEPRADAPEGLRRCWYCRLRRLSSGQAARAGCRRVLLAKKISGLKERNEI